MDALSKEPLLHGPADASDILTLQQGKAAVVHLRRVLKQIYENKDEGDAKDPLDGVSPRQALAYFQKDEDGGLNFDVEQLEKQEDLGLVKTLECAGSSAERGVLLHAESFTDRGFDASTASEGLSAKLSFNVVSLFLNDNGLQKVEILARNLRSLTLCGNPLQEGVRFACLSLIHLDLSFTS